MSRTRPVTKLEASKALYAAIDTAALNGRSTPCRLSGSYDAEDLDLISATELVRACRTACPVLTECTDLAAVLPLDARQGVVIAGRYYPATRQPRWRAVYKELRGRIDAGEYAPGDRLPTMRQLTRETGVHGNVIRTVFDHLERDDIAVADGVEGCLIVSYAATLATVGLQSRTTP